MTAPKPRPVVLDLAAPMASLRAAAGLSHAAIGAARVPPVLAQSIVSAERSGGAVGLATLAATAEACGGRLEVRFVPGDS